eukprot:2781949-Amphidinium_carterae.1
MRQLLVRGRHILTRQALPNHNTIQVISLHDAMVDAKTSLVCPTTSLSKIPAATSYGSAPMGGGSRIPCGRPVYIAAVCCGFACSWEASSPAPEARGTLRKYIDRYALILVNGLGEDTSWFLEVEWWNAVRDMCQFSIIAACQEPSPAAILICE